MRRASAASKHHPAPLWLPLAAMAAAVALAAAIGHGHRDDAPPPVVGALEDRRSPAEPPRATARVLVRLSRPALGALAQPPVGAAADRYVASLRAEARALRGALRARGIPFSRVVSFGRTYDGFAATVRARDLARLPSLGVRAEPVRRFYPAAAVVSPRDPGPGCRRLAPGLALIDVRDSPLLGFACAALPIPTGGPHRVPGQAAPEVYATSDEVVAGLERAVRLGARVALVGVSAPFAGFADAPEARAANAADRLGTLVVAPAGNEDGPVGSPGGARRALTAGALPAANPLPGVETGLGPAALLGGAVPARAPVLVPAAPGPSPFYDPTGRSRVAGRLALARRGPDPADQVAQAASAGAVGLLLADPDGRPFALVAPPRRDFVVLAVGGAVARRALAARAGTLRLTVRDSAIASGPPAAVSAAGGYSSGKPDVLAPALANTPAGVVAGTGVAAARVALVALVDPTVRTAPRAPIARARPLTLPAHAPALDPLRLRRPAARARVNGVTLVLGRVSPGPPIRVFPAARLVLELRDGSGRVVRTLTPPGGARDLLPGEYAYTLPGKALSALPAGGYSFRATATAPGGGPSVTAVSAGFMR